MSGTRGYTFGSGDVAMETARGNTLRSGGFQLWEKELLESSEVKRKSTVAQLCDLYSSIDHRTILLTDTSDHRFPRLLLPTIGLYWGS
jgi:hypothetical protein